MALVVSDLAGRSFIRAFRWWTLYVPVIRELQGVVNHPIRIASMINNVEVGVTSTDPYLVKSSNPHFRETTSVRIVVEAAVECAVYLTRWHRDRAFPIELERQFDGISPACH